MTTCKLTIAAGLVTAAAIALPAVAAEPQRGGPMNHIMVTFEDDAMHLHVMEPGPMALQNYDEEYDGAASVLNGTWYNAQYGWMPGGFWEPPNGTFVWMEVIDATPGLEVYRMGTFEPIFGTGGSSLRFQWNGLMTHNWYAATDPGPYQANYVVYIGDAGGDPIAQYAPAEITLAWVLGALGDANGDGAVGFADVLAVLAAWGDCGGCAEDVDNDGMVGFSDVLMILANWS